MKENELAIQFESGAKESLDIVKNTSDTKELQYHSDRAVRFYHMAALMHRSIAIRHEYAGEYDKAESEFTIAGDRDMESVRILCENNKNKEAKPYIQYALEWYLEGKNSIRWAKISEQYQTILTEK